MSSARKPVMNMNGKSILVVDEDAAMLRAMSELLAGTGAVVTTACGAAQAIAHLTEKSERFDLMISELRMPTVGGRTLLGAVAAVFPDLPVILMTAFDDPHIKAQCLTEGAAAFLEKPLDTPQLLTAIEGALSTRKKSVLARKPLRTAARKAKASSTAMVTDCLRRLRDRTHGIGARQPQAIERTSV